MTDPAKEPVIFVSQIGSVLQEVKKRLESDALYAVELADGAIDLMAKLDQYGPSLVIFHVQNQGVVTKQVAMMKAIHDRIKSQKARVIVLSSQIPDKLLDLYDRLGCRDILKEPVLEKNLVFKIKKLSSALAQKRKKTDTGPTEAKLFADKKRDDDTIRLKVGEVMTAKGQALKSALRLEEEGDHDNLIVATLFLLSELRYAEKKSPTEMAETIAQYLKQFVADAEVDLLRIESETSKAHVIASSEEAASTTVFGVDELSAKGIAGFCKKSGQSKGALVFRGNGSKVVPQIFVDRLASALEPVFDVSAAVKSST